MKKEFLSVDGSAKAVIVQGTETAHIVFFQQKEGEWLEVCSAGPHRPVPELEDRAKHMLGVVQDLHFGK